MVDKFKNYLKIDNSNINDEMKSIALVFYNLGMKEKILKDEIDTLELKLEINEARLASQLRTKYKNAKNILSETHIKDLTKSNPEIIDLKESVLEIRKAYRLIKLKISSLKEKRDMVINIGHNIRTEKESSNYHKVK